jgi:hypothetical protein
MGRKTWESLPQPFAPCRSGTTSSSAATRPTCPSGATLASSIARRYVWPATPRGVRHWWLRAVSADAATCQSPVPDRSRRGPRRRRVFPEVVAAGRVAGSLASRRQSSPADTAGELSDLSTSWSTSVASRRSKQPEPSPAVRGRSADVARRLATRIRCRHCLCLKFPMPDLQTYLEGPKARARCWRTPDSWSGWPASIRRSRRRIWARPAAWPITSRGSYW